jgi:ATP-dependent Clp protease ATP-binding subunit ClpA
VFERFRQGARRVVELAQEEAQSLGHNYIGTEHLLIGLVGQQEGLAAKALASQGITQEALRKEVTEIIGTVYPPPFDRAALANLGIDLEEVRRRVEATFGPGALERTRASCIWAHRRFTPRAKKVLELALREAIALRHGYLDTEHVLLGLIREGDGLAVKILKRLGVTPREVESAVHRELQRKRAS